MIDISKNKKRLLILSYWGYPFGGGEEYLYQTAIWAIKHNLEAYWLCFSNAKNNTLYKKFSIEKIDGFTIIKVPIKDPDFNNSSNIIYNWIKLLKPNVVHHQGHYRKLFYDIVSQLRIEFISGIHFWSGIIDLDPQYGNINILENYEKHKINSDFEYLIKQNYCTFYSVSKYVTNCIEKITNIKVNNLVYSGSLKSKCLVRNNNPINNKYVTFINIHKLKGGDLILYLLKNLYNIPFLLIVTEYNSEELDNEIYKVILERENDNFSEKCLFFKRMSDIRFVFKNTKIFIAPSLVDETFCRTVNEAMMNNIPVISTGQGNISYLIENGGISLPLRLENGEKDMELWKDTINELYFDNNKLQDLINKTKSKYLEYSDEKCEEMFINLLNKTLQKSKEYNIMIFTPWCDQGLGIQSKNYYNILTESGYRVHIFSIKPYNANSAIDLQKDPNDWIVNNNLIYYSSNTREEVKDIEIIEFIKKYNIGKCIIPETCWYRVFEIAKLLRENDVKCYAIPNIEIVRKDEIVKHIYFYKILCNNKLCESIFNKYGLYNTEYIGYGVKDIIYKNKRFDSKYKLLFIGGMNAFSRKHILEICDSFVRAYDINNNIELTCTIQKTNMLEVEDIKKLEIYINHPAINFIQTHLKYEDIINLYYSHHMSIQVSKHEGLGLGFYEALYTGTPVITLNTQPHNEIILDNVNGYVIDCYYKKMTDNPNSFIKSAYFEPINLCNKILQVISNKDIYNKLIIDLNTRLSYDEFKERFINSL